MNKNYKILNSINFPSDIKKLSHNELKVLANEGLITLQPNRGAWVTQLTAANVDELFPIMGSLEALSGELACKNATDADIAEIKALHYEMAMYYTRGDRPNYFRVNFALVQHHKYSLSELESMVPWEREIYVDLLLEHLKEERQRLEEKKRNR